MTLTSVGLCVTLKPLLSFLERLRVTLTSVTLSGYLDFSITLREGFLFLRSSIIIARRREAAEGVIRPFRIFFVDRQTDRLTCNRLLNPAVITHRPENAYAPGTTPFPLDCNNY